MSEVPLYCELVAEDLDQDALSPCKPFRAFWILSKRVTISWSKNSHKKLATPEENSQLDSNCPISKAPDNSWSCTQFSYERSTPCFL